MEREMIAEELLDTEKEKERIDDLVKSNIGLVGMFVKYYKHCGVPLDDLMQEGSIGLIEAARRFDVTRGVKFSTYARYWIFTYIRRAVNEDRVVYLPHYVSELRSNVWRERCVEYMKTGNVIDTKSIIEKKKKGENFRNKLSTANEICEYSLKESSIDKPVFCCDSERGGSNLHDLIADEKSIDVYDYVFIREVIELIGDLPPREFQIVWWRLRGMTLQDIGDVLGLTRERIRQIEASAIDNINIIMKKKRGYKDEN
jgi:RNA polymerase sigma factor (sigma-70 family)